MTGVSASSAALYAKWIWTSEQLPPDNQFVYFRKQFTIGEGPCSGRCLVTAERFYQLWLNGTWLGKGPALGHPHEKAYDTYEVTDLLMPGRNVIAAVVHFDDDDASALLTRWYAQSTQGVLWCQLEGRTSQSDFRIITDDSWLSCRAQNWDPRAARFNDLCFQEIYTAARDPANWGDIDFDDREWSTAVVLGEADGTALDGGQLPWRNLSARDIPALERRPFRPVHVYAGETVERMPLAHPPADIALQMSLEPVQPLTKAVVEGEAALLAPGQDVCILHNSDAREPEDSFNGIHDATVILDFGQLLNADLTIEAQGAPGTCLDIGYSPDLLDGRVNPYRSSRTSWADRVILDEGWLRWRSFRWRQFRFVQITVRNALQSVRLREVIAERVTQQWSSTTEFNCSNARLETYWQAAAKTAEACTTDIFMDNASREARQYSGDISQMVPSIVAAHGNEPICRRYLRHISLGQLPSGLFMDCCPGKGSPDSSNDQVCVEHGLWHVKALWEHYMRLGNHNLLEEHWGPVQRHIALWNGLTNHRGLLDAETVRSGLNIRFYFPWIDWADIERRGEQLPLNAIWYHNLRIAGRMGRICGEADKATEYDRQADDLGEVLTNEFWDDRKGLFGDALIAGRLSPMTSEHSQGTMLLVGLASDQQAARLVETWQRSPQSLAEAEISYLYYILEGLVKYGYSQFAMHLLGRLDRHLRAGRETFGEVWNMRAHRTDGTWATMASRAVAQGSGAWPCAFLLEHIAGFQPRWGTKGCVRLAPQLVVDTANADWCGNRVQWHLEPTTWKLSAQFVEPTPVEIQLPFCSGAVSTVQINGTEKPVQPVYRLEPHTEVEIEARLTSK